MSPPTTEEHWVVMFGETQVEVKAEIDDETHRAVVIKLFVDERLVSCVVNRRKNDE